MIWKCLDLIYNLSERVTDKQKGRGGARQDYLPSVCVCVCLTSVLRRHAAVSVSYQPANRVKRQDVSTTVFLPYGKHAFMVSCCSRRPGDGGGARRDREPLRQASRRRRALDGERRCERDGGGGVRTQTTARFRWDRRKTVRSESLNRYEKAFHFEIPERI